MIYPAVDKLQEENSVLRECLKASFKFLSCEQGWEAFRAEMLFSKDEEKKTSSAQNAESIRRFIRDSALKHPVIDTLIKEAEKELWAG